MFSEIMRRIQAARRILGIPPGGISQSSVQPAKPPEQRAKVYWPENEITAFGSVDEMLDRSIVTFWRDDPSGTRWYVSDLEALTWWRDITAEGTER